MCPSPDFRESTCVYEVSFFVFWGKRIGIQEISYFSEHFRILLGAEYRSSGFVSEGLAKPAEKHNRSN